MMKALRRLFGNGGEVREDKPVVVIEEPEETKRLEALVEQSRARKAHTINVLNAEIDGVKNSCRALVRQARSDMSQLDRIGGMDD